MGRMQPPCVEVIQGNKTLGRLMLHALREAGFELFEASRLAESNPVELQEGSSQSGVDLCADLLVIDVDSGLYDIEATLQRYRKAGCAVVICGLRASRESYPDQDWLGRPFSIHGFLAQCLSALNLPILPCDEDARFAGQDFEQNLPENSASDTQKLTVRDAEQLEEVLGLDKGVLSQPASEALEEAQAESARKCDDKLKFDADVTAEQVRSDRFKALKDGDKSGADTDKLAADAIPADASYDRQNDADNRRSILELDDADLEVLDASDEQVAQAPLDSPQRHGVLAGGVVRKRLESDELDPDQTQTELDCPEPPQAVRSTTLNSTLPEVPAVKLAQAQGPADSDEAGVTRDLPAEASLPAESSVILPPAIHDRLSGTARMLAGAWDDIGLTARPSDRAERIEKIMRAALGQGLIAGEAEVERIPAAPGFSGNLSAMGWVELLATVRDHGLRGRVELSIGPEDFVLYLDAQALDEIENLSGNDDALLLEILGRMGCLSQKTYDELQRSLTDKLAPPLPMQLRESGLYRNPMHKGRGDQDLIATDDLHEARRLRALRLFKKIRRAEKHAAEPGHFAFMQVGFDAAHAWPVDALGLNVDELLEAVDDDSQA